MKRTQLLSLVLLTVAACQPDPSGPRDTFETRVVPILERSCSATTCHGVARGAEAGGEVIDWSVLNFHVGSSGQISDIDAAYKAVKRVINTRESARFSPLLRKPLAVAYGGSPHFTPPQFPNPGDSRYQTIERWIESEKDGGVQTDPLTPLEQQFADDVQPALASMGCMLANCHGIGSGIPFRLDPGVPGEFSLAMTRANYDTSKRMISLDGDPLMSRIIRKILPLSDGGIIHKGGNSQLLVGTDDPRLEPIREWVCAEQLDAMGLDCSGPVVLEGMVFLRGFVGPQHPFELDSWVPGTDLFFAELSPEGAAIAEYNLTASLHGAAADVRDPAVDPLGEHVAFAMRTAANTGHELYEIDLETRETTRLTHDAGPLPGGGMGTWRDPTYGPDGHIWAVSTTAGKLADGLEMLDGDLYEIDPESGEAWRRSYTPHIERKPVFFTVGNVAGEVSFSALRNLVASRSRGHIFGFPPDLHTEYHQHFGITPLEDLFFDMRELPDGTYVTVVGTLENKWGGRLGLVDRNFGPTIPLGAPWQDPGLPVYVEPLSRLDELATPGGQTEAIWRDPVGLPDGRLLAALAVGPADHGDAMLQPDFAIQVVSLEPDLRGDTYRILDAITAIDAPTIADYDPEPVYRRYQPAAQSRKWDPEADTAVFRHHGYDVVDALLGNLPPSGPKEATPDVVAVRLVESLPIASAAGLPGLGRHGPARILAEVPLAADGTFAVEVPAGIAIWMQGIDERGVGIGSAHNRWIDFHPGQTIDLGVQPQHYAAQCAACHGAIDGDPDHVFVEADLLTSASITQSTHASSNPRRPLPPIELGENTRIEVDFTDDVQPILDSACRSCHSGPSPGGDLALDGDAYASLLQRGPGSGNGMAYVDEPDSSAMSSFLVEILLGDELAAPRFLASPGQRHPDGPDALSEDELLTLIRWVDLGATYVGRGD